MEKPSPKRSLRNLAATLRSFFVSVGRSKNTRTHITLYSEYLSAIKIRI